jgi:UDP-N-acetylmuramate dehydrogenase
MGVPEFDLSKISFSRTGGKCSFFFTPVDEQDLINFLSNNPCVMNLYCLGNLSNVLVRDDGIEGCVLSLNSAFDSIEFMDGMVEVGAGVQLFRFINMCADFGISCCEELSGIPGTIGGSIFMNAGTPLFEICDVVVRIKLIDHFGNKFEVDKKDLRMEYRKGNIGSNVIICSAILRTKQFDRSLLNARIRNLLSAREKTQPIGERTCGSTFKNPIGMKAWKLIHESGCIGMRVGGASVSKKHCNFFINNGNATSADFLNLISAVRDRVFEKTGITLEPEIVVIP